MNAEELRERIEAQGYEVKNIRVFSKTFHVNYWGPECKMVCFYKVPLESLEWRHLKGDFPKVGVGGGNK